MNSNILKGQRNQIKGEMINKKSIAYWVCTVLLAFFIGSGGLAELARVPGTVDGIVALGYPVYFVMIIGFWKVLGAISILTPRFPRLKEWAYAGIFFNMTGAAVTSVATGSAPWHLVVDLLIAALVVASWALRPQSKVIGVLFPDKSTTAGA